MSRALRQTVEPALGDGWTVLDRRRVIAADPHLTVDRERIRLPNGRVIDDYYRVGIPDFVLIYATTIDGAVIVERQYKHALGRETLTLPGGRIDPGETPMQAARRELLEETGFMAMGWRSLGAFMVNGNQGCGTAHVVCGRDARCIAVRNSGDLEEMSVEFMRPDALCEAVFNGDIGLLGHAAAIGLVNAWRPHSNL